MAALLVLLHHLPGVITQPFFRNGFYGVDLFFILSGFILYHVHGEELTTLSWAEAKRFYRLRFWRVYPLHAAVLAAVVVLVTLVPAYAQWVRNAVDHDHPYSFAGLIQTLLLLNCVGLPSLGMWNGPSWSLSSEALAYVFFPLMVPVFVRTASIRKLYALSFLLLTLHALSMYSGHRGATRVVLAFPVGIALARIFHLSPTPVRLAVPSVMLIFLFLAVDQFAPFAVFGFAGLILSLAWNEGALARLLSSRPTIFLGLISFSLYLTHHTLLLFLSWVSAESMSPALMGALALFVGWVTYKLVEAPSHKYARTMATREDFKRDLVIAHSQPIAGK